MHLNVTEEQTSITTIDCEVSFQVEGMDYGTIMVPKGTEVHRLKTGTEVNQNTKVSDWWIKHPEHFAAKNSMKLHDAIHRGIIVPTANVKDGSKPFKSFGDVHVYRH